MHFYDHHAYIVLCLSVVCPTSHTWGSMGDRRKIDMSECYTWGTIPRTIPLHIPFKYPISPCCAQCVKGRYGCLNRTIPTKYPPLGEDFGGKFPFHQHLPQVCHGTRWGIQTTGKARYVSALRDKCRH